jgi:putative transcription antitermination factor YqgF
MAFPKAVLPNDKNLITELKKICEAEKTEKIILGESKNLNGEDNEIARAISDFKNELEKEIGLPVAYEPEFYTSAQAARIQGESDMIDASAATIILQSYLDKYTSNGYNFF